MDLSTERFVASELTTADLAEAYRNTISFRGVPYKSRWRSTQAILKLTTMWAEGLSATQIADAMGMTKNAVIGKVHRLNLPKRKNSPSPALHRNRQLWPSYLKPKPPWIYQPKTRLKPEPLPPEPPHQYDASHNIPFMETVGNQCRWIIGEPTGVTTLACGAPSSEGPYCSFHHRIAYRQAPRAKQKRSYQEKISGIRFRPLGRVA